MRRSRAAEEELAHQESVRERWAREDLEFEEVEWTPELEAWANEPALRLIDDVKNPPVRVGGFDRNGYWVYPTPEPPKPPLLERLSRWLDPAWWEQFDALETPTR